MKSYKKISVERYVVESVRCNCCGKPIPDKTDYLSIEKRWGYGTSLDNSQHNFDLCEECYTKIIANFKISPCADDNNTDRVY
jgi:ribosomal-protein-alanine N-acetyltransferase